MRLFGLTVMLNNDSRYAIVDIKRRIREIYANGDNEAAYAAYRHITGSTVQDSWRTVKPWIKEWGLKNNG